MKFTNPHLASEIDLCPVVSSNRSTTMMPDVHRVCITGMYLPSLKAGDIR